MKGLVLFHLFSYTTIVVNQKGQKMYVEISATLEIPKGMTIEEFMDTDGILSLPKGTNVEVYDDDNECLEYWEL